MKILDRFTIRTRLVLIMALLVGLIALIGGIGASGMSEGFSASERMMEDRVKPAFVLARIRMLQAENRAQVMLGLQHDPVSPFAKLHDHPLSFHTDQITRNAGEITALFGEYEKRKITDPGELRLLPKFRETRDAYVKEGLLPARQALLAGEFKEANEILLTNINPLFKATSEAGSELGAHILAVAESERSEGLKQFRSTLWLAGTVVGLGVLASFFFGWALLHAIVRPLERLRQHFAVMAAGDLRQPVEISGDNEVTRVQSALAATQAQLVELVGELRAASGLIASHADQLRTEVRSVAENSQAQQDGVMQVSAAMEEVSVSISEVAHNTDETAAAADRSAQQVRRGNAEVDKTASETQAVGAAMQTSVDTMHALQDSVQKISAVTKVIREVADQTNLLALNAAIEAARAGEQGRGFAVVADEVRKLAERTAKSTADIATIVSEVQGVAGVAAGSMAQAQTRVATARDAAQASGEVLAEVLESANAVSSLTRNIAEASAEQSSATTSVAQSLERMSTLIADTHVRIGKVEAASGDLADTAGRLQGIVRRFQVS